MKAMILAAGKGTRMRPLTNHTPKPLLEVGGKALITHHIEKLAAAGFDDIIINVSYLGEQVIDALGTGAQWGVTIAYSQESEPLETAGGILHAQALLGDDPFLLINGDVWTDYPLAQLRNKTLAQGILGHLVLVDNPEHNLKGDFSIDEQAYLRNRGQQHFTFSGLSVIKPELIKNHPHKRDRFALGEVFKEGINQQKLSAEIYLAEWVDVGTIERLNGLNHRLSDAREE